MRRSAFQHLTATRLCLGFWRRLTGSPGARRSQPPGSSLGRMPTQGESAASARADPARPTSHRYQHPRLRPRQKRCCKAMPDAGTMEPRTRDRWHAYRVGTLELGQRMLEIVHELKNSYGRAFPPADLLAMADLPVGAAGAPPAVPEGRSISRPARSLFQSQGSWDSAGSQGWSGR